MDSVIKKIMKGVAIAILAIFASVFLLVIGYLLYVLIDFSRLPDNIELEVKNNAVQKIEYGRDYTVMTYNVGFGAYGPDYTFFMDTGVMKDGTKTQGEHGTAVSLEDVQKNISGSAALVKEYSPDFAIIQELDHDSTRSYNVDQREYFTAIDGYGSVYAENYHSSYLFYPFDDPHGKNNAGIVSLSKYNIESSVRRSFPIDNGFSKFTDLDRCFSVTRMPLDDKYFVLISLHMSAYDEGGVIRKQQAELLSSVLKSEYDAGNYVVAGGDFNQDLIGDLDKFESEQQIPSWVSSYDSKDIPTGFSIAADTESDVGSCRGADVIWQRGYTYTCVIDGFIVSDNIDVKTVKIIDNDFKFSDHNPVVMTFSLLCDALIA